MSIRGLPLSTYVPRLGVWGWGGVKPPIAIHFHCVLHAKKGGGGGRGIQIACKIVYVLNGRPLILSYKKW